MCDKMLCWPLFGTGFENLGKDKKPCEWEIPEPENDQLLVRIDAIGLCFSDVKLIRAGEDHPRVYSQNLSQNPVIPGHEAVMTVVKAGDKIAEEYPEGSRYIIQADIYVNGKNWAYGYAIDGGMAQYSIIDQRVLNGDEGSYLLPLADKTPATLAALIEPWTCVIASYMIENRTSVKQDGKMLVVFGDNATEPLKCESAFANAPALIHCLGNCDGKADALKNAFANAEFECLEEVPQDTAYDDLVLYGLQDKKFIEEIAKRCNKNAVVSFIGTYPDAPFSFDVGSIHYKGWFYQGTPTCDLSDAYGHNVRSELKKSGACWLVGGAGAMGQMHTQLAVEDENGPDRILVTDMDSDRLQRVAENYRPVAEARGATFKTLNPQDFDSVEAFNEAVRAFSPEGYEDIIMLVPVVPVINGAVQFLAEDGVMNIFAGIPAGKEAELNIGDIVRKGVRFIGSSGSLTAHLRHTLSLVEQGKLQPVTALAAVGGMRVLWDGINGVAEGRFPGKTVILPQCEDIPLAPVGELGELDPELLNTLDEDGNFTLETERAILSKFAYQKA